VSKFVSVTLILVALYLVLTHATGTQTALSSLGGQYAAAVQALQGR
jgi:hypothetical protein